MDDPHPNTGGPETAAAVPIFVTADLDRALTHYRHLGFSIGASTRITRS